MKTLSSIKPRERTAIAATRDLIHDRYVALVENSPQLATTAHQQIQQIKQETVQGFLDAETERQFEELQRLSDANKIMLEKTREEIAQKREELQKKHAKESAELEEIQAVTRVRLGYFNAEKKPRKTQSKEFLGLQKEFLKLMQLKEFQKAEEVQKIMKGCEFDQMEMLMERYEAYCQLQVTQLETQQRKETENLNQKHQTEQKNFEKDAQLKIFQTIQNIKNAKHDMLHAHQLEFINFQSRNVDRDIVIDKRGCNCPATLRGSQKLQEVLSTPQAAK